jgi:plastocyanin
MFSKLAFVFFLPAFVLGQDYGAPAPGPASSPTPTTSAAATVPSASNSTGVIGIDVGANGKFVFSPANITAPVGTLVTFFFPGSIPHSVTQSSFADPCTHLTANTTASTPAGFDSGLVTSSTFTINVTDNQPIWFHCKQVTHCGLGMVGSINAPATGNTFDKFQAAALQLGSNAPTETGPAVTGGVHGVATAAPSSDVGQSSGGGSTGGGSTPKSDSVKVMASAGAAVLSAVLGGLMLL